MNIKIINVTKKSLFSEFSPVTKQEWIEKVNVDLKGADFDKTLVWKNLSDINIKPFYNTEDNITQLKNTGENSQSLVNYRLIDACCNESGNKLALKAIEEGMNGLIFKICDNCKASDLLQGINLNEITVSFILGNNAVEFAKDFFSYASKNGVIIENLKGYFNTALISNYVTTATVEAAAFDTVTELVKLADKYPNYKAITISGTEYLDSGANQVQEIAYTLNSLVYVIDELTNRGIEVQSIFNNLNLI